VGPGAHKPRRLGIQLLQGALRSLLIDDPDAVVSSPLHECPICLRSLPPASGIFCGGDGQHFVCTVKDEEAESCFTRHVLSLCGPGEDPRPFRRAGCKLYCPIGRCTAAAPNSGPGGSDLPFPDRLVALSTSDATFAMYQDARRQSWQAIGEQEGAERARERELRMQSTDYQARLAREREIIATTALNLQAPCCGMVLYDKEPDDCAAAECAECSRYFCFLCLGYAGDYQPTHNHVRECPRRQQEDIDEYGYFDAPGEQQRIWRQLRNERLDKAFAKLQQEPVFVVDLVELMEQDLRDLGLDPLRWRPAPGQQVQVQQVQVQQVPPPQQEAQEAPQQPQQEVQPEPEPEPQPQPQPQPEVQPELQPQPVRMLAPKLAVCNAAEPLTPQ
jgi:hypothetical protein